MKTRTKLLIGIASTGAFFAYNLSLMGAGSLTPPGAPAPTMKTLDEIDAALDFLTDDRS